jgi:hypothetical protein
MAARALSLLLTILASTGCADESDYGLRVEAVDASFGLARSAQARGDTGAALGTSSSPAITSGALPPETPENQPPPGDAAVDAAAGPSALDAGPPARDCKNVAGFTQNALPAVIERCVRCHDGTKSKATKATDFTRARDMSPAAQQATCREALKAAPDTSEQSPLFAEVNPSDAMTVHDFKYPSAAMYTAYRSTVLLWLQTETAK